MSFRRDLERWAAMEWSRRHPANRRSVEALLYPPHRSERHHAKRAGIPPIIGIGTPVYHVLQPGQVFMESGLCHVIGRLAQFDVGMNYTQDLIDSGADMNAWLDWLYYDAIGLASDHREYVEEMDSIAIPDSDTLESVTYTNTGTHSGKALLLWQAMIGYSAMTRVEYDGL